MNPNNAVNAQLHQWRQDGRLRALDLALLTQLIDRLQPDAPPALRLASCLLAALEAEGHSALPLTLPAESLLEALGWPAQELPALQQLLQQAPLASLPALAENPACAALLERDPQDDQGSTPLVLDGGRLYLRRYWRYERQVLAVLATRQQPLPPPDAGAERLWLDRLFPPHPAGAAAAPDWQREAGRVALRQSLTLLTGGPGTGKTYTAARLLVLLQALQAPGAAPLRIALAAPTGKAAARLRQSMEQALQQLPADWREQARLPSALPPARTLHGLLGARPGSRQFAHHAGRPLALDLLFVDEASMVDLEMMAALLQALPPGARLLLLGDADQLASVEAGAVLGALCARPALAAQTVRLTESRRFDGAIGTLARQLNAGDGEAALALLRQAPADSGLACVPPQALQALVLEGYGCLLREAGLQQPPGGEAFAPWALALLRGFDRLRLLCALRDGEAGASGLNARCEQWLEQAGVLRLRGARGPWYLGRPVLVTRNDAQLGLFNGDIGIVLADGSGVLRACFADGERLRAVAVSRLPAVETAFAMTVHKSQGSEFGHVALVLPDHDHPLLSRELLYTGLTRARLAFTLVAADPQVLLPASRRRTRRLGGL